MVLPEFDYSVAATLEEACKMQAEWGASAKVMAGGTDIVPPMKDGALKADHIISIARIPGLDTIEYDENEGLKILDTEYAIEDYAIAISKDNEDLLEAVDKALNELIEDGTVASIVNKYIGTN